MKLKYLGKYMIETSFDVGSEEPYKKLVNIDDNNNSYDFAMFTNIKPTKAAPFHGYTPETNTSSIVCQLIEDPCNEFEAKLYKQY